MRLTRRQPTPHRSLSRRGGRRRLAGMKTTLIALLALCLPLVAADKDKPLPKDFKSLKPEELAIVQKALDRIDEAFST
jgi:hypothetical protein